MSVDKRISLGLIREEIAECSADIRSRRWVVSEPDPERLSFIVIMVSPRDHETFILDIGFDNYREMPLCLEFVDPVDGRYGTKRAYPKDAGNHGSLFHTKPCICHPASRTAYGEVNDGPHKDWEMSAWEQNPKVGSLRRLKPLLQAIWFRIATKGIYEGRMSG